MFHIISGRWCRGFAISQGWGETQVALFENSKNSGVKGMPWHKAARLSFCLVPGFEDSTWLFAVAEHSGRGHSCRVVEPRGRFWIPRFQSRSTFPAHKASGWGPPARRCGDHMKVKRRCSPELPSTLRGEVAAPKDPRCRSCLRRSSALYQMICPAAPGRCGQQS